MKELKVIYRIGFRRDRIQISILILSEFKPINESIVAHIETGGAHFSGILTVDVFRFQTVESTLSIEFQRKALYFAENGFGVNLT